MQKIILNHGLLATIIICVIFFVCVLLLARNNNKKCVGNKAPLYIMPEEGGPHEGTWLQWPHHYQYGIAYRNSLDMTWVAMTKELLTSEKVHLIAFNQIEKDRIIDLLKSENTPMANIDFKIYKTDDIWIRDNGPIYAREKNGSLVVQDWGFNGWGGKADYSNCNSIPSKIATDQGKTLVDLNSIIINEGGSVEVDGHGTLMACKSSILNSNRNPRMTMAQAEDIFHQYLGVSNFIWLDGQAGLEITDQHIDGFARFGNANTIVTMKQNDLLDFDVTLSDVNKLYNAKNINGTPYNFLKVPLTQNKVTTASGKNLGYKGSYINYYISNSKILVPNYNDPNDSIANEIIQTLYPSRTVVGIDVRNLYENGGMIHCITLQQPQE